MTLEKVHLNKNSKQVKFRGCLWLSVTFKINSHKSYWAQIHRKHLSSPFYSQNRALTNAIYTDRSLLEGRCVTSTFSVFHATGGPYLFYFFVAFKKIFPKKNLTTFLRPP